MKKSILLLAVYSVCIFLTYAQVKPETFTKEEKKKIDEVLGKDFKAVYLNGSIAVARPDKVNQIKVDARSATGFKSLGSAASSVFAAKKEWWVYKNSGRQIEEILGEERFAAFNKILLMRS